MREQRRSLIGSVRRRAKLALTLHNHRQSLVGITSDAEAQNAAGSLQGIVKRSGSADSPRAALNVPRREETFMGGPKDVDDYIDESWTGRKRSETTISLHLIQAGSGVRCVLQLAQQPKRCFIAYNHV